MPFDLRLTAVLRKARWKVKIRDKESREAPHATILRGTLAWRIDLRTRPFMDDEPDPAGVPAELLAFVAEADAWRQLCEDLGPHVSGQSCLQP